MSNLEIIVTADGSHSLLNKEMNETYHSQHGALQESKHVFINKGLQHFIESNPEQQSISIFEVGFGTGLNALLTLQFAMSAKIIINYTSIEAFPLPGDIWSKLNYGDAVGLPDYFRKIHEAPWDSLAEIHPNFLLNKLTTTLQNIQTKSVFNLVFFDAFAPNKQPEMWEMHLLEKVVQMMTSNSVFVTYCAKGQVKRDLKSVGLVVETHEGPPGKKEMVRGLRN
jgi:tRNA U34 5-methylaminomethyl-2-thiouridine-forming methyltransferase MnmC